MLMEKYQFVKQIAQSSFADVWLVKCAKTRKKHILKRIDLCHASKREQRAAHLEVKLLSTIKHPNIVTYIDSFHNSNGSLYIVMSYYESGDLHSFLKNQNGTYLEEKQIVHWFVQICLALKYLHDKNILHRNLKTRNIFLSKNKIIKVGDLGISRVLSVIRDMTSTLIEIPYYISPEILAGDSFNQKSDIWALGCCIYEITTLKHPFVAQDIQAIIQKIKKGKLPPIPEIYSVELFDLISSMLNQNVEKRPSVTNLLLNDYIRRYILIILQDNPTSPNQEVQIRSELAMDELKTNPELKYTLSKDKSNSVSQKTKSNCLLPKNIKSCDTTTTMLKADAIPFISIPDINGNGDGNDNSQHRRFTKINKSKLFTRRTECKDFKEANFLCPMITAKCRTQSDSDLKESSRHRNSSVSSCNSLKSSATSFKTNNELKARSEISFRILNNVTYILHNPRYKAENVFGKNSYEIKNLSQVKSPECTLHKKQDTLHEKTNNKRGDKYKRCSLPQILSQNTDVKASKSAENIRELPLMKSQDFMSNSSKVRQHIMKNTEGKIDDSLLKNIVVNEKISKVF